ncbi:hypothetical protein ACDI35_21100 [Xanthomonas axonopodis pv. cajani]|uniref:hypothetical protein n=1 Tax=Xanthomonas axonopodis TaxID=53413 RepID=UPI003557E150
MDVVWGRLLKGHDLKGERPDFYCDMLTKQFAIEAKGYSAHSISDGAMAGHKAQSKTGPLPVNFSAASVSYNLYRKPKIKFYDPDVDGNLYDSSLNIKLRELYYKAALDFVGKVSSSRTQSELPDYFAYTISTPFAAAHQILVHRAIFERGWENIEWLNSTEQKEDRNGEFYIDVDGIGLVGR